MSCRSCPGVAALVRSRLLCCGLLCKLTAPALGLPGLNKFTVLLLFHSGDPPWALASGLLPRLDSDMTPLCEVEGEDDMARCAAAILLTA